MKVKSVGFRLSKWPIGPAWLKLEEEENWRKFEMGKV